jgi:8-oxo-dGTP pyrophosphatase MutT (NUDIX family)
MNRPPEIRNLTSSGGVITRFTDKGVEVALVSVRGRKAWCLPKGMIDRGEEPPQTALREVREETGLTGRLIDKIGHISYWYYQKDDMLKIHKTVHLYLLKYVSGSTDDHDHEVDEARWFQIDKAISRLSYRSEKDILQKARDMIEDGAARFKNS